MVALFLVFSNTLFVFYLGTSRLFCFENAVDMLHKRATRSVWETTIFLSGILFQNFQPKKNVSLKKPYYQIRIIISSENEWTQKTAEKVFNIWKLLCVDHLLNRWLTNTFFNNFIYNYIMIVDTWKMAWKKENYQRSKNEFDVLKTRKKHMFFFSFVRCRF